MKTRIRKVGNSLAVLIPKPFLAQIGVKEGEVEIAIEHDAVMIRNPLRKVRHGWADASKAIAAAGDDKLLWPAFANEGDKDIRW